MDIEAYLKKDYIIKLIETGAREDGRGFEDTRPLEITKGYAKDKAPGSAMVKLGDTTVIVGVSMDVGEPYSDAPKSGIMSVTAEFRPMASPTFESGPPREDAIELSRVVDRGIRESGAIDVEKLFIEEEKVWAVFIDIHIIDYSGNLIDAAGLAAISALLDARMPKYEDDKVVRGEWSGKLPITCTPIPITFAKIRDKILIDPTLDEEYAMDARLTIGTTDTVNAMQKGGHGKLTQEEVERMVDLAFEKAPALRKKVEE
ncbi:MAG: exosome complex protein Rrp42 [Candidatus Altiarchaeota archaeon]|nr:exosome complex protein Rrp42 [Candidatus Altiarchaeota archaeon]